MKLSIRKGKETNDPKMPSQLGSEQRDKRNIEELPGK